VASSATAQYIILQMRQTRLARPRAHLVEYVPGGGAFTASQERVARTRIAPGCLPDSARPDAPGLAVRRDLAGLAESDAHNGMARLPIGARKDKAPVR